MNTQVWLTASALLMGAVGIGGTFAPHEIAAALRLDSDAAPMVVQLLAALLFGFAMTNWMSRRSLIGGIYNRALVAGNLAHFTIGALALAKAVAAGERRSALVVAAVLYMILAIGFAVFLFRSPVQPRHNH